MTRTEPFELNIGWKGMAVIIGALALWAGYGSFSSWQETRRIEADKEIRVQELRTIEEMTRAYGNKMSPEELKNYMKSIGINYNTRAKEGDLSNIANKER